MELDYAEIIDRMRWSARLKNDSAVARALSITPQALSNYKKRGTMPTNLIIKFSELYGLSVDWLLTGSAAMYKEGVEPSEEMKQSGMTFAHENTLQYGKAELSKALDFSKLDPDEIIYIGKLLKIIRSDNEASIDAVKCNIDAFITSIATIEKKKAEEETKSS